MSPFTGIYMYVLCGVGYTYAIELYLSQWALAACHLHRTERQNTRKHIYTASVYTE